MNPLKNKERYKGEWSIQAAKSLFYNFFLINDHFYIFVFYIQED